MVLFWMWSAWIRCFRLISVGRIVIIIIQTKINFEDLVLIKGKMNGLLIENERSKNRDGLFQKDQSIFFLGWILSIYGQDFGQSQEYCSSGLYWCTVRDWSGPLVRNSEPSIMEIRTTSSDQVGKDFQSTGPNFALPEFRTYEPDQKMLFRNTMQASKRNSY